MSWGTKGFEEVEDAIEQQSNQYADNYPRAFWVTPKTTKRILILDNDPFCFWEHSLYSLTGRGGPPEICLEKAGQGPCPLCEADVYASYVGYSAVIDMGEVEFSEDENGDPIVTLYGYEDDDGNLWQFGRKAMATKAGGKDKPGQLPALKRRKSRKGGVLRGTVWDVHRAGKKSERCGDQWDFVEAVKEEDIKDYLVEWGADPDSLELHGLDGMEEFSLPDPRRLQRLVDSAKKRQSGKSGRSSSKRRGSRRGSKSSGAPF